MGLLYNILRTHYQGCHLTTLVVSPIINQSDAIYMSRKKHSKQEIEDALCYAEENGWRVEVGGSHAWGKIYCPYNNKECRCGEFCITSIWSTPRNAGNHGKQIRRVVDNCTIHGARLTSEDVD